MDKELQEVAQGIRNAVTAYQVKNSLSFVEDTHTYTIKGLDGQLTTALPSVSTVLHSFYVPFDATTTRAYAKCGGDPIREAALIKEWADLGVYAANKGSRVHFTLEQMLVAMYGNFKEVRQPNFVCDKEQIVDGDRMITAGQNFLKLMHSRGAIMLDTEMVLGSAKLGYVGQPDNAWLMRMPDKRIGIVITDWKTNKPKNFLVHGYTKKMKKPFKKFHDTALTHYYVQLPLYGKLLIEMLKGTKYANVPFLGGVVVLLKKNGSYEEYKIPKVIVDEIKQMDMKNYLH